MDLQDFCLNSWQDVWVIFADKKVVNNDLPDLDICSLECFSLPPTVMESLYAMLIIRTVCFVCCKYDDGII